MCTQEGIASAFAQLTEFFSYVYMYIHLITHKLILCHLVHINLANGGAIAGAVIAVLVTLAIVGGITAAVVYFVVRSRSASYVARRYIYPSEFAPLRLISGDFLCSLLPTRIFMIGSQY